MSAEAATKAWQELSKQRIADDLREVQFGLDSGLSTDEIAANVGRTHDRLVSWLKRRGGPVDLHQRLIRLRREELERKRHELYAEWQDRPRCPHGAWSSTGDCEHGKMGRYAA